jgi:hypothetical protein
MLKVVNGADTQMANFWDLDASVVMKEEMHAECA